MTNAERIQSNNEELRELIEIAENLPDAGSGGGEPVEPNLQEKSVTPTKSEQEVTADDGFGGLSKVIVKAIPATYQDITGTTAESNHVLEGEFFVNDDGVMTEGTMPNRGGEKVTLDVTNPGYNIPEGYHDGDGEVYINLETKSVTPAKSAQTITPSAYRVLSKVNVGAIPDEYIVPTGTKQITANGTHDATEYAAVEVNVPSQEPFTIPLGVTANGTYEPPDGVDGYNKVTVNVPVPDGYIVPSGAKEITENGEHDVTAYATVNVNVASSGGGEGDSEEVESLLGVIQNTVANFESDKITELSQYAFAYRTSLKTLSLPNLKSSNTRAFTNCNSLVSLSIPNMTGYTYQYMAAYCSAMTTADVKNASYVSSYSFYGCSALTKIEFNRVGTIATNAFNGCTKLATLILRTGSVVSLGGTNAFTGTKIAGTGGYIYVPKTLDDGSDGVEAYKAATNWSTYDRFRAIEDYPSITGG